ncbi:MAG: hypothetical protein ACLP7W_00820 [Solirubrobacteraceae bacterium]
MAKTLDVYYPWVSLAITMLDSYAHRLDDAATGDHSYTRHVNTGVRSACPAQIEDAHQVEYGL